MDNITKIQNKIKNKYLNVLILNNNKLPDCFRGDTTWPKLEVFNVPDQDMVSFNDFIETIFDESVQIDNFFIDIIPHSVTSTQKYYKSIVGMYESCYLQNITITEKVANKENNRYTPFSAGNYNYALAA